MKKNIKILNAAGRFCDSALCGVYLTVFTVLSAISLTSTTALNTENSMLENIYYQSDSIVLNLLSVAAFFVCMRYLRRFLERISEFGMILVMSAFVFLFGFIWTMSVQSVPAHDSNFVASAALKAANGNLSFISDSYFRYFPFQLGYVFFCEIFIRIFRFGNYFVPFQLINLFALIFAYIAICRLSLLVSGNRAVHNMTAFLLAICLQPVMYCTFVYGNIVSFSLAIWAVLFTARMVVENKKRLVIPAAFLLAVAVAVKQNSMIILAALCIILVVETLKTRRIYNIIAALVLLASSLSFYRLIILGYAVRSETDIGGGIPKLLWMNMGLNESEIAPGWYNAEYTVIDYQRSGCDPGIASKNAKAEILQRLVYFKNNPEYALSFFYQKEVSQWNEPSYDCIWISETKGHYVAKLPFYVGSVYKGAFGRIFYSYFNLYQQIIFFFSAAAMLVLLKKPAKLFTILPLIILGGFLYHTLFEGKSQYVLTYFVLTVPLAAYGICRVLELNCNRPPENMLYKIKK